ncbi:MAG: hypothetical protein IRZ20_01810 [Thermoleophilia bacterium]|nr:hypothetical protein [Thermoleophilia bacterium]
MLSFQELATDEQLVPGVPGASRRLASDKEAYRLVVVDEAHALRNEDTTWYRAMERLLGGERKQLVLLTATPVNNGLWDLYNLVMLFARHDRAFSPAGIPSLRRLFVRAGAGERDPESLDPDVLFPVADAVSVRRDRRFIQDTTPARSSPTERPCASPSRDPRPGATTSTPPTRGYSGRSCATSGRSRWRATGRAPTSPWRKRCRPRRSSPACSSPSSSSGSSPAGRPAS